MGEKNFLPSDDDVNHRCVNEFRELLSIRLLNVQICKYNTDSIFPNQIGEITYRLYANLTGTSNNRCKTLDLVFKNEKIFLTLTDIKSKRLDWNEEFENFLELKTLFLSEDKNTKVMIKERFFK